MGNVRKETLRGIKWQLLSKLTLQPATFIFGIILARLITPEEMGILALTSIFFALAMQLKECGLGTALLRKCDRTEVDINTIFWFNIAMSFVMCVLLCLGAPLFAHIFQVPALVEITYVSALMMFLNSTATVHWTLYSARRDFKTTAVVSTITTIIPMPFTIWAAFSGWSYWAIVFQGVASGFLSLIVIWTISPWKPRFLFSKESLSEFFSFGSKLLFTNLIALSYGEMRNFIIGKFYSPAQLAFFHRSSKLVNMPVSTIQGVMSSISFPILSGISHDENKLIRVFRMYFRLTVLLVSGTMISIAANSTSLIYTLYGEQWIMSALYAQILVFGLMFNPISSLLSTLFLVKGRADITLKVEAISRSVSIVLLLMAACHSVIAVCLAAVISCVFFYLNMTISITRMGWISHRSLISDTLPYILLSLLINIPVFILNFAFAPSLINLLLGGACSLGGFITVMQIRYDETWSLLIDILHEKGVLRYIPLVKRRSEVE